MFGPKIFQGPVYQFIPCTEMVCVDNSLRTDLCFIAFVSFKNTSGDFIIHSYVGVDNQLRTSVFEHDLSVVFGNWFRIDGSPKSVPVFPFAAKLSVEPRFCALFIFPEGFVRHPVNGLLDIPIHFSADNQANLQIFTVLKQHLIKKSCVGYKDDGNIIAIVMANEPNHIAYHPPDMVPMVTMGFAISKYRINKVPSPEHL